MYKNISDARLETAMVAVDMEKYLRATNSLQGKKLIKAIRNRDVYLAMRVLEENALYREEVEYLSMKRRAYLFSIFIH